MKLLSIVFVLIAVAAAAPSARAAGIPVLLELFTSEGCSSCPPADRLLEQLDRQPVPDADLIVVSEHVDYWNGLGWKDPFSSLVFTARQKNYSDRLATDVYTPQLVLDGVLQTVGNDRTAVLQNIAIAARKPKLPLAIHVTAGSAGMIRVETTGAPATADLYVIVAANRAQSQVLHGENGGRVLTHVAVAQSLTKIGKWTGAANRDLAVRPAPTGETRIIAFLTDPPTGKILGVAMTRF